MDVQKLETSTLAEPNSVVIKKNIEWFASLKGRTIPSRRRGGQEPPQPLRAPLLGLLTPKQRLLLLIKRESTLLHQGDIMRFSLSN